MLSVDHSEHLTDPVRDSRLQASFHSDGRNRYTVHTHTISYRTRPRREVWMHKRDLGQGGFGFIQLQAQDVTGRSAAQFRVVKSVRVSGSDLAAKRALYVRELEAMVKFSHQKYAEFFVTFYGWYDSPGWIHIAMEYCELGDFQSYLSNARLCPEGRLPEDQVRDISSQVLDALLLMHGENFSHRDLKPANILIKKQPPDPWWIKVCDLGLSKRIEDTASTAIRGTPGFMPPELLGYSGNPRAVDARLGDMWCLGELAFQTLTGHATFDNVAELGKYCGGIVSFPSQPLRDVEASESAIEFLTAVMQFNPSERLSAKRARSHAWMKTDSTSQTNEEFSQTLVEDSEWFMNTPFGTQSDQVPLASAEWSRTVTMRPHSSTVTQTAEQKPEPNMPIPEAPVPSRKHLYGETDHLTSKMLTAMLNCSLEPSVSTPDEAEAGITGPPNSPATFGQKRAGRARDVAAKELTKTLELVMDAFGKENYTEAEAICRNGVRSYEATLGQENPSVLRLRSFLGACLVYRRRFEEGEQLLYAVLETQQRVSGKEDNFAIVTRLHIAGALASRNQYKEAEKMYWELHEALERTRGRENMDTLSAFYCLGESIRLQGRFHEAEVIHSKAYEMRKSRFGARHASTIESHWAVGEVCRLQGRIDEAEKILREAADISELTLGKDHRQTLQCLLSVGQVLVEQNKLEEAKQVFHGVFKSRERLLGAEDPVALVALNNFAVALGRQSQYLQAEKIHRKIVATAIKALSPETGKVLQFRHDHVNSLCNLRRYDEANTICDEVVKSREKVLGKENPVTLSSLHLLAEICFCQERLEESEEIHRQVLHVREKVNGSTHVDTLNSLARLAIVLSKQGKHRQAEELARGNLERLQKAFGSNDARTLDQIDILSDTLLYQGKWAEAETLLRHCVAEKTRVLGEKDKATIESIAFLGTVLCHRKEYVAGIQILRHAEYFAESTLGADFWLTNKIKEQIALADELSWTTP